MKSGPIPNLGMSQCKQLPTANGVRIFFIKGLLAPHGLGALEALDCLQWSLFCRNRFLHVMGIKMTDVTDLVMVTNMGNERSTCNCSCFGAATRCCCGWVGICSSCCCSSSHDRGLATQAINGIQGSAA